MAWRADLGSAVQGLDGLARDRGAITIRHAGRANIAHDRHDFQGHTAKRNNDAAVAGWPRMAPGCTGLAGGGLALDLLELGGHRDGQGLRGG
jgi:hypothetical protein